MKVVTWVWVPNLNYINLFISANQEKNLTSRLECIADFFNICFRAMNSFKADKIGQLFPSGDDMGYPIIKYMAKYYLRHFKGMFYFLLYIRYYFFLLEKLVSYTKRSVISLWSYIYHTNLHTISSFGI